MMKSRRHIWLATALVAITGWLATPALAAEVPVVAHIEAISAAPDPSAVVTRYARALAAGPAEVKLHEAYVARMVELGVPELAFEQAKIVVSTNPGNGLAWAVVAYGTARTGDMTLALSAVVLAVSAAPDDDFVQRTAGELLAWYDAAPREGISARLAADLESVRQKLGDRKAFREQYEEALAAYKAGEPAAVEVYRGAEPPVERYVYSETYRTLYAPPAYSWWWVDGYPVYWPRTVIVVRPHVSALFFGLRVPLLKGKFEPRHRPFGHRLAPPRRLPGRPGLEFPRKPGVPPAIPRKPSLTPAVPGRRDLGFRGVPPQTARPRAALPDVPREPRLRALPGAPGAIRPVPDQMPGRPGAIPSRPGVAPPRVTLPGLSGSVLTPTPAPARPGVAPSRVTLPGLSGSVLTPGAIPSRPGVAPSRVTLPGLSGSVLTPGAIPSRPGGITSGRATPQGRALPPGQGVRTAPPTTVRPGVPSRGAGSPRAGQAGRAGRAR